jgi:predicted RNA binding protein YcfA (HicA-like mRNA interferase family)
MKVSEFLRILLRKPLEYEIERQKGSHRTMTSSNGFGRLLFSGHEGDEVGPTRIKKILVDQVGLTEEQAIRLLREGKL